MKPEHHKIVEQTELAGRKGNRVMRYVLRYNSKLFDNGACNGIDTDVFYPVQDTFTTAEEKVIERMCIDCPVMMACLEWGLAHERYGVWGGTTPARRKAIRTRIGWVVSEPKI